MQEKTRQHVLSLKRAHPEQNFLLRVAFKTLLLRQSWTHRPLLAQNTEG